MTRCVALSLSVLLVFTSVGSAQPSQPGPYGRPPGRMGLRESTDLARYWINSYLRRQPTPDEVRYWSDRLRSGRSPADALAALLASPEYTQRVGGTQPDYIRQLTADVGHHEPSEDEVRDRFLRTRGLSRLAIAYRFLQEFPANWWPGPQATPPAELLQNYSYGDDGYGRPWR